MSTGPPLHTPADLGSGLNLRGLIQVAVGAGLLSVAWWTLLKAVDFAVLAWAGWWRP